MTLTTKVVTVAVIFTAIEIVCWLGLIYVAARIVHLVFQ